jgi:hypothetical protein
LFLCSSTNYLENRLIHNDLIFFRNNGDNEEDVQDTKEELESQKRCAQQGGDINQFRIPEFDCKSNLESRIILHSN